MAAKTKRGSIPSIKINKDFLKDLGDILEAEFRERNDFAEEIIKREIEQASQEINSRTYYKNEEEREQAKLESSERIRALSRPHIRLNYSINTQNEELTFTSIKEIIDTKFFPENIESIACSVTHYGKEEYVDININVSKPWFGIAGDYKLSSSSENRLLKIENDLKGLFRLNPTEYKTVLYPTEKSFYIIPRILAISLATAITYLSYKNFGEEITSNIGATSTLLFWTFLVIYWFSMIVIKWAFPYFKFEITNENQLVKFVRILIIFIVSTVVGSAVYDLLRSLF